MHRLDGLAERAVTGRRNAVFAHRHPPRGSNFSGDFRPRQNAAIAWLGALAHFDFNQLDRRSAGVDRKAFGIKHTVVVAVTKIVRANFPDQITTNKTVVGRDRTLIGVVRKAAHLRALIQCLNGVGQQRAKAKRRNVNYTGTAVLCTNLR